MCITRQHRIEHVYRHSGLPRRGSLVPEYFSTAGQSIRKSLTSQHIRTQRCKHFRLGSHRWALTLHLGAARPVLRSSHQQSPGVTDTQLDEISGCRDRVFDNSLRWPAGSLTKCSRRRITLPLIPRQPMWSWHVRGPDFFRSPRPPKPAFAKLLCIGPHIRVPTSVLRAIMSQRSGSGLIEKEDSSHDCPPSLSLSWPIAGESSPPSLPGSTSQGT